jgi:hypothetical protein
MANSGAERYLGVSGPSNSDVPTNVRCAAPAAQVVVEASSQSVRSTSSTCWLISKHRARAPLTTSPPLHHMASRHRMAAAARALRGSSGCTCPGFVPDKFRLESLDHRHRRGPASTASQGAPRPPEVEFMPHSLTASLVAYSGVPSGPWQLPPTAPASRPTASARWPACPEPLPSPSAPSPASPAALARLQPRCAAVAKNRTRAPAQPLVLHTYPPTLMLMPVRLRPRCPGLMSEPYPTHPTPLASSPQVPRLPPRRRDALPRQPRPRSRGQLRPLEAAARACRRPAMVPPLLPA